MTTEKRRDYSPMQVTGLLFRMFGLTNAATSEVFYEGDQLKGRVLVQWQGSPSEQAVRACIESITSQAVRYERTL